MSIHFELKSVIDEAGGGEHGEAQVQDEQDGARMDDEGCPNETTFSKEPMNSLATPQPGHMCHLDVAGGIRRVPGVGC